MNNIYVVITQQSDSIKNLPKHFENTSLSRNLGMTFLELQSAKVVVKKVGATVTTFLDGE